MKKLHILILLAICGLSLLSPPLKAQEKFQIFPCETEEDVINIIDTVFLKGLKELGMVSNISFTGDPISIGRFIHGDSMGFHRGIILTTGKAKDFEGPNNYEPLSFENNGVANDPDCLSLVNKSSGIYDGCIIEFDVITQGAIQFDYVFGSEEYNYFVPESETAQGLNDVFGFFCSGPGIVDKFTNQAENIAIIPNSTDYVGVKNIHCGKKYDIRLRPPGKDTPPHGYYKNCDLLIWNNHFKHEFPDYSYCSLNGFTVPLTAKRVVTPCKTYHLKFVVSDYSDHKWDCGVLLGAKTIDLGKLDLSVSYTNPNVEEAVLNNCNEALLEFELANALDTDISIPISYVSNLNMGTDIAQDDVKYCLEQLTIPQGETKGSTSIKSLTPIVGNNKFVEVVYSPNICATSVEEIEQIPIHDKFPLIPNSLVQGLSFYEQKKLYVNCEDVVECEASPSGGYPPYQIEWNYLDSKETSPGSEVYEPWYQQSNEHKIEFPARISADIKLNISDACKKPLDESLSLIVIGTKFEIYANNTLVCPGDIVTLTADAEPDVEWSTGETSTSIEVQVNEDMTISCSCFNPCLNNMMTKSIDLKIYTHDAELLGDTLICLGESITLNASEGEHYQWSDSELDQASIILNPVEDHWYWVEVTNFCGQKAIDSLFVDVKTDVIAYAGEDVEICRGEEVSLSGQGGETVEWWKNGSIISHQRELNLSPIEDQSIYLRVYDDCVDWDTIHIKTYPNPNIKMKDTFVEDCSPAQILIENQTSIESTSQLYFDWYLNDQHYTHDKDFETEIAEAGVYNISLKATSEFGCFDSLFMEKLIHVYPIPESEIQTSDLSNLWILQDYNFSAINAQDNWSYEWLLDDQIFNDPSFSYEFVEYGDYEIILNITSEHNCSWNKSIHFEVQSSGKIAFIPNAFSPNGDGLNDYFQIVGEKLKDFECQIFDRWGQLIYHSTSYRDKWDGRYKNTIVPNGAYVIRLKYVGPDGKQENFRRVLYVIK